jgi:hypothetical protein
LRPKKQFKSEVTEKVNQMRKQMFRKSMELISFAIVAATLGSSASVAQGTMSERQACEPDVFRLCSNFIPNVGEIVACLRGNEARLSEACRQVMSGDQVEPGRYTPVRSQSDRNR